MQCMICTHFTIIRTITLIYLHPKRHLYWIVLSPSLMTTTKHHHHHHYCMLHDSGQYNFRGDGYKRQACICTQSTLVFKIFVWWQKFRYFLIRSSCTVCYWLHVYGLILFFFIDLICSALWSCGLLEASEYWAVLQTGLRDMVHIMYIFQAGRLWFCILDSQIYMLWYDDICR